MPNLSHQVVSRLTPLFVAFTLLGCTSLPEQRQIPAPAFPPPPEQARFIYDGSLRSSQDVEVASFSDKLRSVATGSTIDARGLVKPYGIVVHDGQVFVSDTIQRAIMVFDIKGKRFRSFGFDGKGTLIKPMGLDISSRNELFVADITAKRVVVYDLEGNFLRAIGNDRLFNRPSGVAVSPDGGQVYVVDTGGIDSEEHHVYAFDAQSGELLRTIGTRGEGPNQLNLPLQASTAADGSLYVVDSGNFRVQRINPESGEFVQQIGSMGRRSGQFSRPKGIATDKDQNIYVVDTAFGNFQVFNKQGQLLLHVGDRGTNGGPGIYMLPAGIDVDKDGRIYVIDQFFRKIDIYRPAGLPELEGIPKM
jgi:DNA-binding beta-propeller fold protein YncE